MRSVIALFALALGACVYPAQEPTGLELSWRFLEANDVDGEEAMRVRSCAGADVETVEIHVADTDDTERTGTFRYACPAGFQTIADFQTEASETFVRLDSGGYTVSMRLLEPDGGEDVATESRMVEVAGRGVSVEPFLVTRAPFDWTLTLASADACEQVAVSILYDDPMAALPEHVPEDEDEEEAPVRYRAGLVTDRGLPLDGTPQFCSADLDGEHVVPRIDRGTYLVEVTVDGRVCPVRVSLAPNAAETAIDLAELNCDG